jgi:hypothetical protein
MRTVGSDVGASSSYEDLGVESTTPSSLGGADVVGPEIGSGGDTVEPYSGHGCDGSWGGTGPQGAAPDTLYQAPAPDVGSAAPAGAAGTAAADAQKLKEIKELLKDSPTGAAALKYMEDNKIPLEFASGGGSVWNGSKIVIDRNHSVQRAAFALVHEMNHAKATLEKTSPDVNKETRADYVSKSLKEEVAGVIKAIETKRELVAAGKTITAPYPMDAEYNAAYDKAVRDYKASNPGASAEKLKEVGAKAGEARVALGFKNNEVSTGNTHESYADYYGKQWDRAHRTP